MAIKLEIHATDPEVISLVQRYWAMNEECRPVEKVDALLPFREILKSHALAGFIRTQCTAFDENQSCSICGCALSITSRSEVKRYKQHPLSPCAACKAVLDEARRVSEAEAQAELERRVANRIGIVDALTIRYDAVPDDVALMLLALDRAVAPRLVGGCFTYRDCHALAPIWVEEFVDRLWNAKVLSDAPRATGAAAYSVKDEGLSYYSNRIKFSLVPDEFLGAGTEAFQELIIRPYTDKKRLLALWYDYAVVDCMAYLYDQCEEHRLQVPPTKLNEIKSTVYTALKFFSVAEVWCMMWRVVQNTASLSNRKYYTREKAAATMPGKLLHQFEAARKGNTELTKYQRIKSLPAGMLGQVFNEFYGLDEDTDSAVVIKLFAEESQDRNEIEAKVDAKVRALMAAALENDMAAAVMFDFAELIRNGAGISDAIEQIVEVYAVSSNSEVEV